MIWKGRTSWCALAATMVACCAMLGGASEGEKTATLGRAGNATVDKAQIEDSATSSGSRKATAEAADSPMAVRAQPVGSGASVMQHGPRVEHAAGSPNEVISGKSGHAMIGRDCIVDQNQPNDPSNMANFTQGDLAQSFQQAHNNICGAGIRLYASGTEGYVTIGLWDALPNDGGTMLISATGWAVPDSFFDVFWAPVPVQPGVTYYLTFDSDTNMGIAGDTSNPYPYGQVYANAGYQSFPNYDYTFRTYYEDAFQLDCLIDQDQPSENTCMAMFYQPDLAQSFQQANNTMCGAGLKMRDNGSGGNVYIELWDGLPDEGGMMLAAGFDYASPGAWVDVFWPTVSITPGLTYYLVFRGDDTTMCVAGDSNDPYPYGMVFANEGFNAYPNYDYTFRTYYDEAPGGSKYLQPVDCDGIGYYSNINSNSNHWLRYDDFICNQTGDIAQVSFWGGTDTNDPISNIAGFEVYFYEFSSDGPCDLYTGPMQCAYTIPASDVRFEYECNNGGFDLYRYTVDLPTACHQEAGQRFLLHIAARLNDPDLGDEWFWQTSTLTVGVAGASYNYDTATWECGPYDQAFELITLPDTDAKYSQPVNCDGSVYFSNLNHSNPYVRFDDFVCNQTGDIERVVFWGEMYSGCGPMENLEAIQINFHKWLPDGPCGFLPGELLCSYTIPAADLQAVLDCDDDIPDFKYTAVLPEPCPQEEGQHFVLMIAGIVEDPAGCRFAWSESTVQYGTQGGSWDQADDWVCHGTDNAFELYTDPGGKFEQAPNCDDYIYFSNINSEQSPYIRFDDFVCQQTGDIARIKFWGCGFDMDTWYSCGLPNVNAFQMDFYKWESGGDCDWQPGELLCSYEIPLDDVAWEFECTGPNGDYLEFTVDLPEPCYQEEGQHFVLSIAGVMRYPDDPCIFGWLPTALINWSPAASYHRVNQYWSCGGPDQSFALFTIGNDCPGDANGDNQVDIDDIFAVLGNWGPCNDCPEDVNHDGQVDIDDIFMVLGNWGPC